MASRGGQTLRPEWTRVILNDGPLARTSHMASNTRGPEMQPYRLP